MATAERQLSSKQGSELQRVISVWICFETVANLLAAAEGWLSQQTA